MSTRTIFFKKEKNMLFKCIIASVFPFIICFLYCAVRGYSFFDLYLPNSFNNDVLYYYKQVEGVMAYGHPQGYFGFNESHALYGGFAAWNPLLFIPWIIYCLIFGCNYMSLIISNIIFFSIALVIFVLLTEINWNELIVGLVLFALYPSFSIHLMNGLAETNVAGCLIIFFGLAIHVVNNGYIKRDIVWMFALAALLTLCRPFMITLFFFPCFYYIKESGRRAHGIRALIISAVTFLLSAAGYFVYSHYFSSPYITPLFNADLLIELFTGKVSLFFRGIKPLIKDLLKFIIGAFDYGLTAGTQYVISGVAIIATVTVMLMRRNRANWPLYLTYSLTATALSAANILLLNKVNEGGRHLWAFSIVGILLCVKMDKKERFVSNSVLFVLLAFFLARGALVPTDYDIPTPDESLKSDIVRLESLYEENGLCITEGNPWDNTVLWACVEYKKLYSLPKGVGINYCTEQYVLDNMADLKAKYIAVNVDGCAETCCLEFGYEEIVRNETFIIYKRY